MTAFLAISRVIVGIGTYFRIPPSPPNMLRKTAGAILGAMLLWAPDAAAQSLKWDVAALTTYGIAAGADLHSTHKFLSETTMWEGNPLGKPFDHNPTLLVAVSAAADAAIVTTLYRLPFFRDRPRLRRAALYGVASFRVYLAGRNYDRIEQWKHYNRRP